MTNLSGDDWQRYGRGRGIDFYATDGEVAGLLEKHLPKEYGPYSLLWTKSIQEGKKYRHEYRENDLSDFLKLRDEGVWKYFLRSTVITPEDFPESTVPRDWSWSFSGLINVQQGRIRQGKQEWSALGIVDKVQNNVTGEIVIHEEYLKIFKLLKTALRKQLVYDTKRLRSNGTSDLSKSIRMTEGYAHWCRSNPDRSTVVVADE